jgi:hypothetical protein
MTNTTVQKRGVGTFYDRQALEQALNHLKAEGFVMDHVSVIAKQVDEDQSVEGVEMSDRVNDQKVRSSTGVITDAVSGATWGTVLVGLTSLAIPGIGPIVAAGSLGAALITGAAGTGMGLVAFNQLTQAFTELGIPEADARVYSEQLNQGNYLLLIEGTPDEVQRAETLLRDHGVENWSSYAAA